MSTDLVPVDIDKAKVLLAIGLNMRDPNAQAALLVCQRYDLDPLLKHVQLIKQAIYVTRDGYLHVAHQSGVFDGMEIIDEGETDLYFWAKVSVFRKDMSRPFTCTARCRKDEKTFGDPWDMAVTRAERRALKRAFDVSGLPSEGDYDEHEDLWDRETGAAKVTPANAELQPPKQTFEEPPLPDEPLTEVVKGEVIQPEGPPKDEDADGMTVKQNRMLFALLNGAGITSDDERHAYAAKVLERDVDTYETLTKVEASKLIDSLKPEPVAS